MLCQETYNFLILINNSVIFLRKNEELELNDIDKYWNPKLYIENTMGEYKESVWHVVSYNSLGK